jgi:hypothetical protein
MIFVEDDRVYTYSNAFENIIKIEKRWQLLKIIQGLSYLSRTIPRVKGRIFPGPATRPDA